MKKDQINILKDRGIISVLGKDSKKFLQNIITNDINIVNKDNSIFSGIFTPQGKYLYEFFIIKSDDGYFLDCSGEFVGELKVFLEKYKLNSDVEIKDISVEPFRYRSTGKEVSTRSASKTQTLRTCFYISANLIADAGKKEVLIQFIDSQDKILSSSDTIVNGDNMMFSARTSVEYENKRLFVCLDWQRYIPLIEGEYLVKIFIDGVFTSETEFKLK